MITKKTLIIVSVILLVGIIAGLIYFLNNTAETIENTPLNQLEGSISYKSEEGEESTNYTSFSLRDSHFKLNSDGRFILN